MSLSVAAAVAAAASYWNNNNSGNNNATTNQPPRGQLGNSPQGVNAVTRDANGHPLGPAAAREQPGEEQRTLLGPGGHRVNAIIPAQALPPAQARRDYLKMYKNLHRP